MPKSGSRLGEIETRRGIMDPEQSLCETCHGTGEYPTEAGPIDCPDCGGAGTLPPKKFMIESRAGDIERAYAGARNNVATDIRWLLVELRRARSALNEIVALAHDVNDDDAIALRIRVVANRALGLYPAATERDAVVHSSR